MPVPSKPQPPTVSPRVIPNPGQTQVVLDWKLSANATEYEILLEEVNSGRTMRETQPRPPAMFRDLVAGEEYQASVVAINLDGRSPASNILTFATKDPRFPDSFLKLKVNSDLEVAYTTENATLRITLADTTPGGMGNAEENRLLAKGEGASSSERSVPYYKFRKSGTFYLFIHGELEQGGSVDLTISSFPEWSQNIHWKASGPAETQNYLISLEVIKEFA